MTIQRFNDSTVQRFTIQRFNDNRFTIPIQSHCSHVGRRPLLLRCDLPEGPAMAGWRWPVFPPGNFWPDWPGRVGGLVWRAGLQRLNEKWIGTGDFALQAGHK